MAVKRHRLERIVRHKPDRVWRLTEATQKAEEHQDSQNLRETSRAWSENIAPVADAIEAI